MWLYRKGAIRCLDEVGFANPFHFACEESLIIERAYVFDH